MLSLARHYIYEQWVSNCSYQVYNFELSSESIRAMRMVRRYFQALINHDTPEIQHRRYRFPFEYADLSVILLTRIHAAFEKSFPIVAGTRFLGNKAWAVLGRNDGRDGVETDLNFEQFSDLIDHYDDKIHGSKQVGINFLFKFKPLLIDRLSKFNNISCNSVFNIAILFLRDAILHTGPDAEEFFDLFTNDSRLEPDVWDIPEWEKLRCRFLGRFGEINWHNNNSHSPGNFATVERDPVKYRTVANFEMITSGDQLIHNEKRMSAFPITWALDEGDIIIGEEG